jgi:Sel1 repeat
MYFSFLKIMRVVSLLLLGFFFPSFTLIGAPSPAHQINGQNIDLSTIEDLKKAAEEGNPCAQYSLGTLYYNGHGVEKNFEKAVEWFEKAVNQGYTAANLPLGFVYHESGSAQNLVKAFPLIKQAADQGNEKAMVVLAAMYHEGEILHNKSFLICT